MNPRLYHDPNTVITSDMQKKVEESMTEALTVVPESVFWYWVDERHRIYLKKTAGEPRPWSSDEIFRQWKFCNVFRELDTGTAWLRENFLEPHRDDDLALLAGNVCWYRMFNWVPTAEHLGWQTRWEPELVEERLAGLPQIFTNAHIVRSEYGMGKLASVTLICQDLWNLCRNELVDLANDSRSLEVVFSRLCQVHLIGPFMAYEMVTDMRHTRLLEDATDIMTWANAGPGALRGLRRLGLPVGRQAVESMQYLLARSETQRGDHVPAMEMRDIEHTLCEVDKYCRLVYGEGEPRMRYQGA